MRGVFTHCFNIPDSAIDINRHVNNLEYLRWMQDVATEHSTACGWSLERYLETRCSWVIRSHFIEYLRPAFASERVVLATWIADMGEQSSPRKYVFLRESDRQLLTQAETQWVFVNGRTGRPRSIPPELRQDFTIVSDEAGVLNWLLDPNNSLS